MRVLFVLTLAMWCCAGLAADAGAWLREKGSGFVSFSFGATKSDETTNALYVEYGLSEKMTIGVDISAFSTGSNVRNGFANLFVRRSLGPTNRTSKWAYEVGVGALYQDDRTLPAVKTAVSWGRGLQLGERTGWVNVDAGYVYEPTLLNHTTKLDATAGIDFGATTTGILELTLSRKNSDSYGAVEPSLLIKPKRSAFQFKVGAQIPMDADNSSALKLGIWRSF